MDDSLTENAALYALGLLTGEELAAFENALRKFPALGQEVRAMEEASLMLAVGAPQVIPPLDLRTQILAAFPGTSQATNVISFPSSESSGSPAGAVPPAAAPRLLQLVSWAAAAVLAVLFYQQKDDVSKVNLENAQLRAQNTEAAEREQHYLDAIHTVEINRSETEKSLNTARAVLATSEKSLTALETSHSTLAAELSALREDSKLDQTRIAVLGSILKNDPKAVAVSLWRQETQEGLLVVQNLPALPPGRDYQLWVIDPNHKTPVSAGVFKVDVDGKVRIEFKPVQPVREAAKFAVTMEQEGGSLTPHLEQLVVIGG